MGILISGLDEAECRDFIGPGAWTRHQARWLAQEALATNTAGDHQIIWLYRAPWHVLDGSGCTGSQAALARWLESNRAILNMRRQFTDRLTLVNVDRVPHAAFRARLAGEAPRDAGRITDTDINVDRLSARGPLFGLLFERAVPQYWDVLEALEATAWLPSGEPLVRGDAECEERALFELLDSLRDAPGKRAQENAQIRAQQEQMETLQQEKHELKQELELLLLQLHQVQEELEQYYLKNVELEKISAKEKKALQIQLRQMQDELKRHRVMQAPPKAALGSAVSISVPSEALRNNGVSKKALTRLIPGGIRNRLHRAKNKRILLAQLDDVRQSEWFDAQWYLDQHSDIREAKIDPVEHYFTHGWKENRNPGAGFDTAYYLRANPDVTHSTLNPLWHFIRYGRTEGRLPREP